MINIFDYLKNLLPKFGKADLQDNIATTLKELKNVTIPAVNTANDALKVTKIKSKASTDLIKQFFKTSGLKTTDFTTAIADTLPILLKNTEFIEKEIDKLMERDVIREGLTAQKAVLVRATEQICFIVKFTTDLLNVILANEAIEANPDLAETISITPALVTQVTENISVYGALYGTYVEKSSEFEAKFAKIPDVVVNDKTIDALQGIHDQSKLDPYNNPYMSQFKGSPFLWLGTMIAAWEANRYKAAVEKKKQLELRVLQLQLLNEGNNDPKLEREINYTQARIEKLEFEIKKMEESVA